jgi:hypothetical protein
MWSLILRGASGLGTRSVATGAGGVVVTQGGQKIAVEAIKGMATIVLAKEMSTDSAKQERCNKCEPYKFGNKHLIKRSMGAEINTEYQYKIANLSSYPLTFKTYTPYIATGNKKATTPIEEWNVGGTSFDGLWPMECILVEAKGQYAQFLDSKKPQFLTENIFRQMVDEASSQKIINLRYRTAKLNWYFYEMEAKKHFDTISGNLVKTIYMPL